MSISVVIPVYNRERIIARAIESVLNQSMPATEIIVVDDGSTDRSAEIADNLDERVRVVRQQNAGAAAARNTGLSVATGDWIAFLDSDDVWLPEKLQLQTAASERFPSAKLVFCDTLVKQENTTVMPSRFALGGLYEMEVEKDGEFARYDRSLFATMLSQSRVITSAVMVRRDLPELAFEEHIWGSEDWALWLKLALRYPLASVDRKLTTMFQQGDNLTCHKAKLYRNDVLVLEDLLEEQLLSTEERAEVESQLAQRRIGATYFSLINGETTAARKMLSNVPRSDMGTAKYYTYWIASMLPASALRYLSRRRAPELV